MWSVKKVLLPLTLISLAAGGIGLKDRISDFFSPRPNLQQLVAQNLLLKQRNRALLARNARLQRQGRLARQRVAHQRKAMARRNLKRAQAKLAKAGGSMLPVVGAAVVAAATAHELKQYCDDIRDFRTFEQNLFGDVQTAGASSDERTLCGLQVESELKPMAYAQLERARDWLGQTLRQVYNPTVHSEPAASLH